ncbi:10139_t:CDS:2 [Entrophospora sp. SA101]|nr:10139_t:CDS:2 [Entrophospora sp. SA101]
MSGAPSWDHNEDIYNLLGKLFIRVERLESNVDLYFDKVYSTRQ